MHHKPDIGLVNPHAEGIGGNHNLGPVIYKILLVMPALTVA